MADNVQSAMLEILKRIQSDLAGVKSDVTDLKSDVAALKSDVADVKSRLERVEDVVVKQRRDSAAMLVMMRATVGVFDQRLLGVEEDIRLVKERMGI